MYKKLGQLEGQNLIKNISHNSKQQSSPLLITRQRYDDLTHILLTWQVVLRLSPSNFMPSTHLKLTTSPKSWTSLFMDRTAIFDPQIRRQRSLGTYDIHIQNMKNQFWAVCWTVKKKVWADYEQILRPVFLSFHG